jgi:hypothetical protein
MASAKREKEYRERGRLGGDVNHWSRCHALSRLIGGFRVRATNEAALQVAVEEILRTNGIAFEPQVEIAPGCRVDILLRGTEATPGDVALELKLQGSTNDLVRQLHRYATTGKLGALVVVTTSRRLARIPMSLAGVPVFVVTVAVM